MIMAYVKMAFAAAMMLVQPIQHGYDRGQVGDGVAVASSRDVSSRPVQPASAQSSSKEIAQRVTATRGERSKPAAHAIIAKQVASNSRAMQRTKLANLQPAGNAAAGSDTKRAKIVDSHPTDNAAANSNARTIQEQVMAAKGLAERLTAAAMIQAPEPKANNTGSSDHSTVRINAEKTAAVSPNNTDHLVAILMARPEIKSVYRANWNRHIES